MVTIAIFLSCIYDKHTTAPTPLSCTTSLTSTVCQSWVTKHNSTHECSNEMKSNLNLGCNFYEQDYDENVKYIISWLLLFLGEGLEWKCFLFFFMLSVIFINGGLIVAYVDHRVW